MTETPKPFKGHEVLRTDRVYDSKWCALDRHQVRTEDGGTQEYHVFRVPDAVAVVPFTTDGKVVMVWQHRHPHGRTHWEVPAGRIQLGEAPAAAAHRELEEETGYRVGRLVELPGFFPINGISDHWAHVYLALDCEPAGTSALEPLEQLEPHARERAHVERDLHLGHYEDGFTSLALFYAFDYLRREADAPSD